jgi:hypothetical protein
MHPAARYHALVVRGSAVLLLPCLVGCVEIDPSYADSFTTTTAGSSSSVSSDSSGSSVSDESTSTPATCDCDPLELCEAGTCTEPSRVLFVNLDGATTTFGPPDASQDVQGLYEELAGTWDPYGADEPTRQMLLSNIAEQWAPFRVVVTDTRPPAGPYLMAVVTATPAPAVLMDPVYVAFPDCGEMIAQDVSFVFASPGDTFGVAAHATFVSGAFGRGLGLRYNEANDDIMGYGDRFVDTCYPGLDPPCAAHHPELCEDDPMQQNSYRELEALLGARG